MTIKLDKYKEKLAIGGRDRTMLKALELLQRKHPEGGIIVETGSTRMEEDWGAGMATLVFGDFCKSLTQYHLFTVDIDHEVLESCKKITEEFSTFITYVEGDSAEFLKDFNQTIDLLYLDSMDCPEYDGPESFYLLKSQLHQLRELEFSISKLSQNPIILLDDNGFKNGGKTRLTKLVLPSFGFKEIMHGKQSLWVKNGQEI